jgi:DNA-binding NarL/FixJ family response regulator
MRASGRKLYEIADRFGISLTTVHKVCGGGTWKHIPGRRQPAKRLPRITEETKAQMRKLKREGWKQSDIAKVLGVSEASVSMMCRSIMSDQ